MMDRVLGIVLSATIKTRITGSVFAYKLARKIVTSYENNDVNIESNGERWLQNIVCQNDAIVTIDVGANKGEWIKGLLINGKSVNAVCYEPIPSTFAELHRNVNDSRVLLINKALSSEAGTLTLTSVPGRSEISSVYDSRLFDRNIDSELVKVEAVQGDCEVSRLSLSKIHILKIDAEGHDYDVLVGFQKTIEQGLIEI